MMESGMLSSQQIKSWAKEVGFQDCGIARARVLAEAETEFLHSVEHGYHAEMHYLERNVDGRFNPEFLLSGCKSVIVVTYNYLTDSEPKSDKYRTARYTWIQDYHILVKDLLEKLAAMIVNDYPTVKYRTTVDSSAISEKRWAVEAGVGCMGKNGLVHNDNGSFFVIGTLLVDWFCDQYDPSLPKSDCGECDICIRSCPVNALETPFRVDARRCVSYHNTEDKMPNYNELALQKYLFGCDVCQEVCPRNKKKFPNPLNESKKSLFLPLENDGWKSLSETDFKHYFSDTSILRRKYVRFRSLIEAKRQQEHLCRMEPQEIIQYATKVLREEADAVSKLTGYLDDNFVKAVQEIIECKGRVIVTGIGKSAIIGQKIVGTFNSTGTPAVFMHAADAVHGDLGIIQKDDIVVCLSKSGNTPEISVLIPFLKANGNILIAIVGAMESLLAKEAHYVLNCTVSREASPNNLAPTSSAMAQLAIGDALASTLIKMRGFTTEDFAKVHPGGILGRRTRLKVEDLYKMNEVPSVKPDTSMQEVILEISGKRLGVTAVVEDGHVVGAITDGDLRRAIQHHAEIMKLQAKDIMTRNPKTIHEKTLAVDALQMMKDHQITNIFVVDDEKRYLGVIHIHDIIKEGIY
ncbi:MAG: tRNA epoxyqueuosine(34) reductase QueG [Bacteroidales bacterium]|nr:tRNA epoxyqueuosine(34) reductase QueG [Bacteroidales bacterium]